MSRWGLLVALSLLWCAGCGYRTMLTMERPSVVVGAVEVARANALLLVPAIRRAMAAELSRWGYDSGRGASSRLQVQVVRMNRRLVATDAQGMGAIARARVLCEAKLVSPSGTVTWRSGAIEVAADERLTAQLLDAQRERSRFVSALAHAIAQRVVMALQAHRGAVRDGSARLVAPVAG